MPLHVIWLSEARYKTSLLLCWMVFEYKSVIIQLKYSKSVALNLALFFKMKTCLHATKIHCCFWPSQNGAALEIPYRKWDPCSCRADREWTSPPWFSCRRFFLFYNREQAGPVLSEDYPSAEERTLRPVGR